MAEPLKTWLFEPAASTDDPRWQGRQIWRRIVVRDVSEAFARLAAEHYALAAVRPATGPGNESPSPVAGPIDVKLYRATEMADDSSADTLTAADRSRKGVVAAEKLE
ncbi:MAG TPA: hypothetical protein VM639_13230 [Dongiaceae bacterium]|nr:hypothetical protein [Dongiaceae bacterium]